ncbi:MAG: GGDEF domain-containing protein [Campylobacterales bacterium]|nr:GGDEF domain-containing protein [Campylobacterales bacterium]
MASLFLVSTELYPEWPIAKLPHTSPHIANILLGYLLQMQEVESLTLYCDIGGWSIPLNYKPVHDLLKTLRIDPYVETPIKPSDVLQAYAPWIAGSLLVLLFVLAALLKIGRLNTLLKKHNQTIERFNEGLEAEVRKRTIELEQANIKLQTLARTDALTGISNRRHFFELAERYFHIAKRNQTTFSILALDIDHFKAINDRYGHPEGDELLKHFSATITSQLRKTDLFGRIGGEEFAIALQNTSLLQAEHLAEKIRRAIEELRVSGNTDEPIRCTISIGIAAIEPEDKHLTQMIKRADTALYKAKELGRNRIVTQTDIP